MTSMAFRMNRSALTARPLVLMGQLGRLGLCLTLAAAAAAASAATQWKWKDAEGRIQYSDRPPPSAVADGDILERPRGSKPKAATAAPEASSADAAKASAPKPALKATDPQLEAKKRKAEEEAAKAKAKAAEDPKQTQARAESCQRARSYEKSLNDGMRISRTNAKGEREVLDDAGRASELARTKELISTTCN
jgi:cytoskeletal protein RodZ